MLFSVAARRLNLARTATALPSENVFSRSFSSRYPQPPKGGSYYSAPPSNRNNPGVLRSYPVYSVVGPDCVLSFKVIPPKFKILGQGTVVLDGGSKGRILLEFAARDKDGLVEREKEKMLRFGLSAEEVGFLLHQLPYGDVKFLRRGLDTEGDGDKEPFKVCRISPGEAHTVTFTIEGQDANAPSSLSLTVQLGEAEVIRRIMNDSIPYMVGWETMCKIQDEHMRAVMDNPQNMK